MIQTIALLIIVLLPALSLIYAMNIDLEYKQKSWLDKIERMKPEPMNRHTYGHNVYPTDLDNELANARKKRYEESLTDLRSQEEIEKHRTKRFRKFYSSKN